MAATASPEPMACDRCGQVHGTCGGHVAACTGCGQRDGCSVGEPCFECGEDVALRPCEAHAIRGGTVCVAHGGAASQVKRAAARRLEERRVASELASLLADVGAEAAERGPQEVLLEQLWRAAAMGRLLELKVGELGEASLLAKNHLEDQVEHPLAGMLRQWTVEAARLAKLALDAGFDERQIRLAEGQAEIIAAVLRAMAAGVLELLERLAVEAGVRGELEAAFPSVMRRALEVGRAIEVPEINEKGA